jgi:MinD-like ATPase involved in chromosome partitioning or flagellar assembly
VVAAALTLRRSPRRGRPGGTAGRLSITSHGTDGAPTLPGLAFGRPGGPLLAVAALCGGAGASTLAALIGTAAARVSRAPVLVGDTGGPGAAVAVYTATAARVSLAAASARLADGGRVAREELLARGRDGLRVMASGPDLSADGDAEIVARILADARLAHALTIIDCATMTRPIERLALAHATHILWVVPATVAGVRRAARVLGVIAPDLPAREVLVARHDRAERRAPIRDLSALAAGRSSALVLMPSIPDLAAGEVDAAIEAAQVALQAIAELLRR